MTDKQYAQVGFAIIKVALVSFGLGVFLGWLIF